MATRPCKALTQAARLALSELEQAGSDMSEFDGEESGRIVIGTLPLSRTFLLPCALVEFRRLRPTFPVTVFDVRRSPRRSAPRRTDMVIGALRDPAPIGDVVQQRLFDDRLVILADVPVVWPERPIGLTCGPTGSRRARRPRCST